MSSNPTPQNRTAPTTNDLVSLIATQNSLLANQNKHLSRIADALEQLARASAPQAPNYKRPLGDFAKFDWSSITAVVKAHDEYGVSAVEWNEYTFTRRGGEGKFGDAIWFSRPVGKDADGNNTYARLITFKNPTEAEPLPKKIASKVESRK